MIKRNVTGKLSATTLLLYREQACWKVRNPETTRTYSKRGCSQSKPIIKSADLKDNVIKTSAKSLDTSDITWRLVTTRWKPEYLKFTWWFWKHLKSANPQTITQAVTNWNTWRKWEFPSHMTIYGYKFGTPEENGNFQVTWRFTGINSVSFGLRASLGMTFLFPPRSKGLRLSHCFDIGHLTHFGQWSGKRNWLVPPRPKGLRLSHCLDTGHLTHFGQWSGIDKW